MDRLKYKGIYPYEHNGKLIGWKVYVYNMERHRNEYRGMLPTEPEAVEARAAIVCKVEYRKWYETQLKSEAPPEEDPEVKAVEAFREQTFLGWDCRGCGENYEDKPIQCKKCLGFSFERIYQPTNEFNKFETPPLMVMVGKRE